MATESVVRFSFDFAELFQPPAATLRVLEAAGEPLPAATVLVPPLPRPRWLGRLLPVLRRDDPLRLEIAAGAAPGFAEHLAASLAAIYAAAGAASGACVLAWPGGMAVGWGGLTSLPPGPGRSLVACDLSAASLALARRSVAERPGAWLVLNGVIPAVMEELLPGGHERTVALPLLGAAELSAQVTALPAALRCRRFGRACGLLAATLLREHLLREI